MRRVLTVNDQIMSLVSLRCVTKHQKHRMLLTVFFRDIVTAICGYIFYITAVVICQFWLFSI